MKSRSENILGCVLTGISNLEKVRDNLNKFEKDYAVKLAKMLDGHTIVEGIAMLGQVLYDLSSKQLETTRSSFSFSLPEREEDVTDEEREKVFSLSMEIIKGYLRMGVASSMLSNACADRASVSVCNHIASGQELNLDTDLEKN